MKSYLASLVETGPPEEIYDLCLDYTLIREEIPAPFRSLEGLEAFSGLEILSLSQHEFSDLRGLPALPCLRELILSQNELSTLHDFPPLAKLEKLDLSLNDFTGMLSLPYMPKLRELEIAHNEIQVLKGLDQVPLLESLNLSGNRKLQSLQPLTGLAGLKQLRLTGIPLRDLTFLSHCTGLESLSWSPSTPDTSAWLQKLEKLRHLQIGSKTLKSLLLPGLPDLELLILKGMPALEQLQIKNSLPRLKTLKLQYTNLKAFPPGSSLPALHTLSIDGGNIGDYSRLREWPALKLLKLKGRNGPPGAVETIPQNGVQFEIVYG